MSAPVETPQQALPDVEQRIDALLDGMTLAEKIGQMTQVDATVSEAAGLLVDGLRAGFVGSVINEVDVATVNELQKIAVEQSRLGIPLLIGRDVIHGFQTVLPVPLGQAATWNPVLVQAGARVAAQEAASAGINWTFAPMIDISRDPRWGRIAESFGEDPFLSRALGVAMMEGFQGHDLSATGSIAACAKHFAGYGAAESGRDYATTNIPENELRNVYLPPFRALADAGIATFMTSFSELDGVPATANSFLLRQILRDEWGYTGIVVSDWDSVRQLRIHGLTGSDAESAVAAAQAGVDMEMAGDTFRRHLAGRVAAGEIDIETVDAAVRNILRVKFRLGLFADPYTNPADLPPIASDQALATAKRAALQSVVLLKNDAGILPLDRNRTGSIAVLGPLADAPHDQLGTWVFDGNAGFSVTPLAALRQLAGEGIDIRYLKTLEHSRSKSVDQFDTAAKIAQEAGVALLFLGEESILSGEAHSRADISLPGAQAELVQRIRQAGTTVIAVILAGRPLTLANIVDQVDALLFAWHPGTMGGPAIAELLFGIESPSGKLPVTFPRMVGQIPIYYNQKNTGKPPTPETIVHIDDIDAHAPQTSLGMSAFHLDAGYQPLFPFGYGLSYTSFDYRDIRASAPTLEPGGTITISAELSNIGGVAAAEVVQLYVRDLVGSVTRPVKELKGFRRVWLEPGETVTVKFGLRTDDLAFCGRDMLWRAEPGEFHAWIGGSSDTELRTTFRLVDNN
jgi:beta-glucosidase